MAENALEQFEDDRQKPLSVAEIRNLLERDEAGKDVGIDIYFAEQQKAGNFDLWRHYGRHENGKKRFRKDLEERLQIIEDLIYFKRIEEGLSNVVQLRINETQDDFRARISGLVGKETSLGDEQLEEIRNINVNRFESLHIRINKKSLDDYVSLVRSEVAAQVKRVSETTEKPKTLEAEQKLHDVYREGTDMLDFILSHLKPTVEKKKTDQEETKEQRKERTANFIKNDGLKEYMKAYLLRKMRMKGGVEFIEKLYKSIQACVLSEGATEARLKVQQLATKMQVDSTLHKEDAMAEMLAAAVPDLGVSREESSKILAAGLGRGGFNTYQAKFARHLEALEVRTFETKLLAAEINDLKFQIGEGDADADYFKRELEAYFQIVTDKYGNTYRKPIKKESELSDKDFKRKKLLEKIVLLYERMDKARDWVDHERGAIRHNIEEYRERQINIPRVIDENLKELPGATRHQLKRAVSHLLNIRGEKESLEKSKIPLKAKVKKLSVKQQLLLQVGELTPDTAADFLKTAKEEVFNYICNQGLKKRSALERQRRNSRSFDVFRELDQLWDERERRRQISAGGLGQQMQDVTELVAEAASISRFRNVPHAIDVMTAYHRSKGITPDIFQRLNQLINASGFDPEAYTALYRRFGDICRRSRHEEVRAEGKKILQTMLIAPEGASDLDISQSLSFDQKSTLTLSKDITGRIDRGLSTGDKLLFENGETHTVLDLNPDDGYRFRVTNPAGKVLREMNIRPETLKRDDDLLANVKALQLFTQAPSDLDISRDLRVSEDESKIKDTLDDEGRFADQLKIAGNDMDTNPYVDGAVLIDIQTKLDEMETLSYRRYANPGDMQRFEQLAKLIEKTMEGQQYKVREVATDDEGRAMFNQQGDHYGEWKTYQKDLPLRERDAFKSLLDEQANYNRYASTNALARSEEFQDLDGIENNPAKLRKALKSLFADQYKVLEGHMGMVDKFTKIVAGKPIGNHPSTMIMRYAHDQQPIERNELFMLHKIDGKPATFTERAAFLVRQFYKLVRGGNFAEAQELFRKGQAADRLFLDAAFFPVKSVRSIEQQKQLFLEPERDPRTGKPRYDEDGKVIMKRNNKIPSTYQHHFADLQEQLQDEKALEKLRQELESDSELRGLPNTLAEDTEFQRAFRVGDAGELEAMRRFINSVNTGEEADFTGMSDEAIAELKRYYQERGDVKGLDVGDASMLSEERMKAIAADYPIIAARMQQLNSEVLGAAAGGMQIGARYAMKTALAVPRGLNEGINMFFKDLNFYSPISIWIAIDQMIEHIGNLAEFDAQIKSYRLLQNVFEGTIIGSEFTKLYQQKEDERVGQFSEAFSDFGHNQCIEKLSTAADQFELKAALIEVFEKRGIGTTEHLMKTAFLRNLNKYTQTVKVPMNYSEDMMLNDEEVQFKVLDKVREAIDEIWGEGTYQSWRNAGASKYDGARKESMENFKGNSPRSKEKWYTTYWEWLNTAEGRAKLDGMHPGEIVGNIEQDMLQGDNNSDVTWGIMQAMICEGYVKLDHVRRLQSEHANDIPIHGLLEPGEAKISGLTDFYLQNKGKPFPNNAFCEFYQGQRAIPLQAYRLDGKWRFPKTNAEAEGAGDGFRDVVVTVHQLQKWREAQPEYHRKMDNCCIGIFTPCYPWSQIENALRPDTQGNIDARPHDIVAAYRGIHNEFAGYMEAMADPSLMKNQEIFKQTIWYAYNAICKTQAYASFLTRQQGRVNDYNMNELDGSPNFESRHEERRSNSGKTNFEKMILGNVGANQRMRESGARLDGINMSSDLRIKFKQMAGYQHVQVLGVNPVDGTKSQIDYTPYKKETFDPAGMWKEVVPSFLESVQSLADNLGFGGEIRDSLKRSRMGDVNMDNTERQIALNDWLKSEAMLN